MKAPPPPQWTEREYLMFIGDQAVTIAKLRAEVQLLRSAIEAKDNQSDA